MQIRLRNLWFAPNRHTYIPNEILTVEDELYDALPPSAEIISANDEIMGKEKMKLHYAQTADARKQEIAQLNAATSPEMLSRLNASTAMFEKAQRDKVNIAMHEAAMSATPDASALEAGSAAAELPTSGPNDQIIKDAVDQQARGVSAIAIPTEESSLAGTVQPVETADMMEETPPASVEKGTDGSTAGSKSKIKL